MTPAVPAPLVLTMGDPAGIGPELTCKAWAAGRTTGPAFAVIGPAALYEAHAKALGLAMPVRRIAAPAEALRAFPEALPVLDQPLDGMAEPGVPLPAHAAAVTGAIATAVRLCRSGQAGAMVTNPITKAALYDAGFAYPGHTEYLAALAVEGTPAPVPRPVMMLAAPALRVVPLTIHEPLAAVASLISTQSIVETAHIMAASLRRDFAVPAPRLAVAGLNPHAGEAGTIGTEDRDIIAPAVEQLRAEGIDAIGPLSADTLFHARARARYDAALCMYHDQALIPIKTLDFENGVNVTLGLPFVRTSPDHGTAYDIAGTGTARADNLVAALQLASHLAAARAAHTSRPGVSHGG